MSYLKFFPPLPAFTSWQPSQISFPTTAILRVGSILSCIAAVLALAAIGILLFSGRELRSSFLSAFDVTANNGTTISMAPQSLLLLFAFMLADTLLIAVMLFFVSSIFRSMAADGLPFTRPNAVLLKKTAVIFLCLSVLGTCSDSLVDYYTMCTASHMVVMPFGISCPEYGHYNMCTASHMVVMPFGISCPEYGHYTMCTASHMVLMPFGISCPEYGHYNIGALAWNVDFAGLVMGMVLYCLSLIFEYGCDLQQLSDETL